MTDLDTLYRAAKELYDQIRNNRELAALNDCIVGASQKNKAFAVRSTCKIERDWVDAIEKGLEFVGKAIGEERQFIRSNGEVQPIEKVKHVSRESVEHLAKHSDFLSGKQESIMPEKLYTVERLNDYAVYENRFLYMLLCKLRDFVALRYNQIVKVTNRYYGELTMNKTVAFGKNRLEYEVKLKDRREDDEYMRTHNSARELLERLDEIQRSINFYLRTPLMIEVSKADKIKTTITKTNILRMDKNFKETVALYEYIMAYDKDGYTVTQEEYPVDPSKDEFAREYAFSAMLSSFFTYEHALGLEDRLKEEYEKEEQRRREEAQRQLAEQIQNLKKRVHSMGLDMEQYMLMLEERNNLLEDDHEKLKAAKVEIETLKNTVASMQEQIDSCERKMVEMKEQHAYEIDRLNESHAAEIDRLNEEHSTYVSELKTAHIAEMDDLRRSQAEAMESYREQITDLKNKQLEMQTAHESEIEELSRQANEEMERVRTECEEQLEQGRSVVAESEQKLQEIEGRMDVLEREKTLISARLVALRAEHGLLSEADDFRSEEAFNELEHQFEVLGRLVRTEWKGVKKMLRRKFFDSVKDTVFKKDKPSSEELKHFREQGAEFSTNAQDEKELEHAEAEPPIEQSEKSRRKRSKSNKNRRNKDDSAQKNTSEKVAEEENIALVDENLQKCDENMERSAEKIHDDILDSEAGEMIQYSQIGISGDREDSDPMGDGNG